MARAVKVYCSGKAQDELAESYHVAARYEGFILLIEPESVARKLAKSYLTEDITEHFRVSIAGKSVMMLPSTRTTARALISAKGKLGYPPSPGCHHYIVGFVGPIKSEWLKGVKSAGGQLRGLYENYSHIVRADRKGAKAIAALPYVSWVGHLPHEARISPALRRRKKIDDRTEAPPRTRYIKNVFTVELMDKQYLAGASQELKKMKINVLSKDRGSGTILVEIEGSDARIRQALKKISRVHGVRIVREKAFRRTSNDVATAIMGTANSMDPSALGLNGKGEIIAVCDTGVDTGDASTIHPDLAGRIKSITSYPINPTFNSFITNPGSDDGAADVDSGHGTHVAGSVLGDGSVSLSISGQNSPIRGLAYKAFLIFQAIEQRMDWKPEYSGLGYGRYLLTGIPDDLASLFLEAMKLGARIHTNSWGGGDAGDYDETSRQVDKFVWDHKDFCILFSAGNDGTDGNADGRIDLGSVTPPGTAKNCITVGACESLRTQFNAETYGGWWPQDYPVNPIASDPMAEQPDEIAAFSSRGPTEGKFIKPDVVAPGTFILSTRSSQIALNNTAWAPFPLSNRYFYMGGTSMATPLTAGAVALIRQYLRRRKKITPSAALLKAGLVAGARLAPLSSTSQTVYDLNQGYGRVNLDRVLAPRSPNVTRWYDRRSGLTTGQIYRLKLKVTSSAFPLRIVLAYTDFPGEKLINNLNLVAVGPGNLTYIGNHPGPAKYGSRTPFDIRNNVEVIHVPKPKLGEWQIGVVASNVPVERQDFALVVCGATQVVRGASTRSGTI